MHAGLPLHESLHVDLKRFNGPIRDAPALLVSLSFFFERLNSLCQVCYLVTIT